METKTTIIDAMNAAIDSGYFKSQSAKYQAQVNGIKFPVNDSQTHILFNGEWIEILQDQEGDFYFWRPVEGEQDKVTSITIVKIK